MSTKVKLKRKTLKEKWTPPKRPKVKISVTVDEDLIQGLDQKLREKKYNTLSHLVNESLIFFSRKEEIERTLAEQERIIAELKKKLAPT